MVSYFPACAARQGIAQGTLQHKSLEDVAGLMMIGLLAAQVSAPVAVCGVLQIEHHLFPAISFMHYPAISAIVEDECKKRGIQYAKYDTLPEILSRFVKYMKQVGAAEQVPARGAAAAQLAKL